VAGPTAPVRSSGLPALVRRVPTLSAWLGAVAVVAFVVVPLWYMVVLSLNPDPVGSGPSLLPKRVSLDNYRFLASPAFGFFGSLMRSVLLSVGTTAVSLLLAVPAGYALGRLGVPGRAHALVAMLGFAFFPGIVLLVPLSVWFSRFGWLDRLFGIGLAQLSFTVPLAVWFVTYAFRTVPREVEDAALVDGAGTAQRIVRVVLPIARPGIAGTTALVFVASWNDYIFSSVLNRSDRSETLPVMMAKLPTLGFLGGQMAAGVLMCAPVALVLGVLLRWLARRGDAAG
jgi:ABC-type glycerol-3-phosphate transport system permease component